MMGSSTQRVVHFFPIFFHICMHPWKEGSTVACTLVASAYVCVYVPSADMVWTYLAVDILLYLDISTTNMFVVFIIII
jgi:hypothetical protein